jgi:hypothetical protein
VQPTVCATRGVATIGPDRDRGPFGAGPATAPVATTNAGDAVAVHQQRFHGESGAKLRARLDGRFDEHTIERHATRTARDRHAVHRQLVRAEREVAHVHGHCRDRGTAGA